MRVKATLKLPCNEIEINNFIVEYNYNQGCIIEEYEDRLDALEYTEEEKEEQERERISHLKCTKRVLALMLQEMGITYNQLKQLIATNEQAQLEWDLCIELERCNPLLDIMGTQLGITPEQIDIMFKYANGEVETLEVV